MSSAEMKMVMHRLMANMIFTTHDGKKSKKIVLNSIRTVNITTKVAIANKIPATPEVIDPTRSDWHKQHVLTSGPAMLFVIYLKKGFIIINNVFIFRFKKKTIV